MCRKSTAYPQHIILHVCYSLIYKKHSIFVERLLCISYISHIYPIYPVYILLAPNFVLYFSSDRLNKVRDVVSKTQDAIKEVRQKNPRIQEQMEEVRRIQVSYEELESEVE